MNEDFIMSGKPLLGKLLVQQNLVSQDIIDSALRVQVGGNRRLGHILVRMKVLSSDQLVDTLAQQLETPIVDIAEGVSPEVRKLIPRYLCQQYNVLPLGLKENNILDVAMTDPSDNEAITNIERYTGKVLQTNLARHSDITRSVKKNIPLSLADFFSPYANTIATRAVAIVSLALVIGLSIFTYNYTQEAKYGEISVTDTHVLYKNHDLILGVDNQGKVSILGHGAFSKGYYSVSFDNAEAMLTFIKNKAQDFSEEQRDWLYWAIQQVSPNNHTGSVASRK